ncbi:hypothetical protein ARMSODRAFT_1010507 [Armillaria solidipes]|uniref:Uncharacterized protein n=1 Tax=Armillaria solidipes TaxID=1076256 RepID=A0A2H3CM64_9AGAR|nr:hypothetical protein ARMSODRAFT_1010507 [Armillaria solidipes]
MNPMKPTQNLLLWVLSYCRLSHQIELYTPAKDPPDTVSNKHKHTETEQSKAGKAQSTTSTNSISSTVLKAKKKIKNVTKKITKITSGIVKGKKTVTSLVPPVAPSEDPPHAQSPSIAPPPSHTSDVDLPSLEDPSDLDSDHSSI